MSDFYSRLSYSFGNEDWETEQQALKIQKDDNILCITASGDRPMNLLVNEAKSVTCIDANPIQNYLFELKKAAMLHLPTDAYLAFLGIHPSNSRLQTLQTLKSHLSEKAYRYWSSRPKLIVKGVIYQGAMERLLHYTAKAVKLLRGKKVQKLFSFDNLEEQSSYISSDFDTFFWRKAFDWGLNPLLTQVIFKDPGLYEHVDPGVSLSRHLYQRVDHGLRNFLAKSNPFLSIILKGKVGEEALPPYLAESFIPQIRENLESARVQTQDLVQFIEQSDENQFDGFSFSDVASYISQDEFTRLIRGMVKAAKNGARFCLRQLISNHKVPEDVLPYFQRDEKAEETFRQQDRCLVYRFMVGQIAK